MSAAQVAAILAASPGHRDALQVVALAGPPGAWIGAGFVRSAVWDALAGRAPTLADLPDLDVVHFAPGRDADATFEAALRAARPLPWSVTEQARMAAAHGHPPYRDLAEALAHWPETATAVAARLFAGRIEILAPHGLGDLLGGVIRPTPGHSAESGTFQARLAAKRWRNRWPELRLLPG